MNDAAFGILPLGKQDRSAFCCGIEALDRYFHLQVSQDAKRRVAGCFVAIEKSTGEIAGFYTLSACHVRLADLDGARRAKLPRYPHVPAVRLGRLAVDTRFRGLKLGSALLVNAVARSIKSDIVAHMMAVDAKDELAARFYEHHGFVRDVADPLRLFASLGDLSRGLGLS